MTAFTQVSSSGRKKRSTDSASCTFTAECEAADDQTNDSIDSSVTDAFSNADADIFTALNEMSLLSVRDARAVKITE